MNINKLVRATASLFLLIFSSIISKDPITASIATIYERKDCLKKTIDSLIDQVDLLTIFLNDYPEEIPGFLTHPKIIIETNLIYGDQSSRGKFFWSEKISRGYHFICDDDLIYPPNYTLYMIGKIEKYKRKAVIGIHGSIFKKLPIEHYYKDRLYFGYCFQLKKDQPVHIIGTGTLAYHTDTIRIPYKTFTYPDCDDIEFSILMQKKSIPMICVQRPHKFIKSTATPHTQKKSIYAKYYHDNKKQTNIVNEFKKWQLHLLA